jgi:hypothetical protein
MGHYGLDVQHCASMISKDKYILHQIHPLKPLADAGAGFLSLIDPKSRVWFHAREEIAVKPLARRLFRITHRLFSPAQCTRRPPGACAGPWSSNLRLRERIRR